MSGLNQKTKKMLPFKPKESYLHKMAKAVLIEWIKCYPERFGLEDYLSIRTEELFSENSIPLFTPDVTVYNKDGLKHIYEICHKSPLKGDKLHVMQCYFFSNKINPVVFEIEAHYIMRQIQCPEKIDMVKFGMFDDGQLF